jgi:hypothetical protein
VVEPAVTALEMLCPLVSQRDGSGVLSLPFQSLSIANDPGPANVVPLMVVVSSATSAAAVLENPFRPSAPISSHYALTPG